MLVRYAEVVNVQQKTHVKKAAVNFLGSLGYFFNVLQWMLVFVIYQTAIVAFVTSVAPPAAEQPVPAPTVIDPNVSLGAPESNVFMTIFAGIIVLATIVLSIYVFIKAPSFVAKTNKKVVGRAADVSTTLTLKVQHQPDTPRRRKKISGLLVIIIKLVVVLLPFGLSLMAGTWSDGVLDAGVAMALGTGLAAASAVFFAGQYGLASLLKIKRQDVS